jgi:hypothetical protein
VKTRNIITTIVAIIAGAITIWLFGTDFFGIFSGVNVAVIIIIGGVVIGAMLDRREEEKQGFAVKDERSLLIEGRAGRLAFLIGNYIWLALLWYEFLSDNWLPTPTIGSPAIVIVGMLAQCGVYFVAMYYYRKNR